MSREEVFIFPGSSLLFLKLRTHLQVGQEWEELRRMTLTTSPSVWRALGVFKSDFSSQVKG